MNVLFRAGANVNVLISLKYPSLQFAAHKKGRVKFMLRLICHGAQTTERVFKRCGRTELRTELSYWCPIHRELTLLRKANVIIVDVRRGETIHVERSIFLDSLLSRSCVQGVLRNSFVHHVPWHFHGTWI